jgi:hypothetical protein
MPYILEAYHTVRNECYGKRFSTKEALCRYLREDCGWSAARISDLLYLGEDCDELPIAIKLKTEKGVGKRGSVMGSSPTVAKPKSLGPKQTGQDMADYLHPFKNPSPEDRLRAHALGVEL